MKLKNTISSLYKLLACLSVAFSLVFSLPFVGQAASGMNGMHHGAVTLSECADNRYSDTEMPFTSLDDVFVSASNSSEDHSSTKDCEGICFSVFFNETVSGFPKGTRSTKYINLNVQKNSTKLFNLLRPPQT